jgi:hypothetical protein
VSEQQQPLVERLRDAARINRSAALADVSSATAYYEAAAVSDALADELDAKDARIAELEARILELETVTDEQVRLATDVHAEEWDRWTVLTRSYGDTILRTDDDGADLVVQTVPSGDGLMHATDLRAHAAIRAALMAGR